MKILLVNCAFQNGSTGKIIFDLRIGLEKLGCETYVAYARGPLHNEPNIERLASPSIMLLQSLCSKVTGLSYECSPFSTFAFKRLVKKIKPDIVNLHCINANTINIAESLEWLNKHNIPTVISEHAEFMHTGGCGHSVDCDKWLCGCGKCPQFHKYGSNLPTSYFFDCTGVYWHSMYKAISNFKCLAGTGVSSWLTDRMKLSPFYKKHHITPVPNGVNTEIFRIRNLSDSYYKSVFANKRVILHVTPNFNIPLKGGQYVLELANRFNITHKDVIFCIVGYNGNEKGLPQNVIPIKYTKNQIELAELYSSAEVLLLTSQRETFSMVTAESLCCGTPVVGFEAGGPESIALKQYSRFCKHGDTDTLYRIIEEFIDKRFDKERISEIAANTYSTDIMCKNYLSVYQKLLKDSK